MKIYLSILSAVLMTFFIPASSASVNEKFEEVDRLFSDMDSTHTPGAAIIVIQNDRVLYKKAFGMANLELGVPNSAKTAFRLGSVSKQFTAACIAMLVLENKMSLDDQLTKFFPELPAEVYGGITISHLLHHTSGIRDSEAMYPLMGIDYSQWYTHEMFIDMLIRQRSLNFRPGDKMEYSNSNYTLLALIVEKVSKEKFDAFAKERIFDPLNMKNTYIQTSQSTFIPNRATGYARDGKLYKNWMTNNQLVGHDAVYSTVDDMYEWTQEFYKQRLAKGLIEMTTTPGSLNNGERTEYASGLVVHKYKGLNVYQHDGWYVGYTATVILFPQQHFSIVCMSNLGGFFPRLTCFKVADIFLADEIEQAQNATEYSHAISKNIFTDTMLKKLSGKYVGIDLGKVVELKAEGDKLRIIPADYTFQRSPYSTTAIINHERNIQLRICPDSNDIEKNTLELWWGIFGSLNRYRPFEEIKMTAEQATLYTGEYESDEMQTKCRVIWEDGNLVIKMANISSRLSAFEKDRFAADFAKISFLRNSDGKVAQFKLDTYGIRNVIFKK